MHESEKWKWSRSVVSDSSRPHGLQPTRLLCPWDFPGKSTGVWCIAFSGGGGGWLYKGYLQRCWQDTGKPSMAPQVTAGSCHCPEGKGKGAFIGAELERVLCGEEHPIGVVIFIRECGQSLVTLLKLELKRLWTSTFLSSLPLISCQCFPLAKPSMKPWGQEIHWCCPYRSTPQGSEQGQTEGIHRRHHISPSLPMPANCQIQEMLQMLLNLASWL